MVNITCDQCKKDNTTISIKSVRITISDYGTIDLDLCAEHAASLLVYIFKIAPVPRLSDILAKDAITVDEKTLTVQQLGESGLKG